MDAAGNIRITGRLKDVINRGGVKFNPADIEALIDQHPSVLQCAIAPLPDPIMGERACCFAVLEPGATFIDRRYPRLDDTGTRSARPNGRSGWRSSPKCR